MARKSSTRRGWMSALRNWLPVLTIFIPLMTAAVGGVAGLYKYLDERALAHRAAEAEQANQSRLQLIASQRPFIDRQTQLYFETASVIGVLMTYDPGSPPWDAAERRYWALYYSELSMVEHCEIDGAMAGFGDQLKVYKAAPTADNKEELGEYAIDVAHALRFGMTQTWSGVLPPRHCDDGK